MHETVDWLEVPLDRLAEAVTHESAVKFILSSTTNDPLQQYYDDVNKRADEIESLREAATFALTLEHRYKIEEIATALSKLYEKTITHTVTPEGNAILCKSLQMHSSICTIWVVDLIAVDCSIPLNNRIEVGPYGMVITVLVPSILLSRSSSLD